MKSILEKGLDELCISISGEQLNRFELFAAELCKWNRKINLTSITTTEEIAVKHFIDSVAVARFIESTGKLLDIGSGGGFPSIPLKILYPELKIVSVDAVGKKINFQKHVARLLGLRDFSAMHARVEMLFPEYGSSFQYIISRAFSDLGMFAGVSLPLLADNGLIIAMKGREGRREAEAAEKELSRLNLAVETIEEYRLPILNDERSIILLRKISAEN